MSSKSSGAAAWKRIVDPSRNITSRTNGFWGRTTEAGITALGFR
jgi:hypothetical protein